MSKEWDVNLEAEVLVDSTAAIGVVNRKGNGKLRHVRIGQLWVQEKRENEELTYHKVKGTENPADLLTKGVVKALKDKYLEKISLKMLEGRADAGLSIATLRRSGLRSGDKAVTTGVIGFEQAELLNRLRHSYAWSVEGCKTILDMIHVDEAL